MSNITGYPSTIMLVKRIVSYVMIAFLYAICFCHLHLFCQYSYHANIKLNINNTRKRGKILHDRMPTAMPLRQTTDSFISY